MGGFLGDGAATALEAPLSHPHRGLASEPETHTRDGEVLADCDVGGRFIVLRSICPLPLHPPPPAPLLPRAPHGHTVIYLYSCSLRAFFSGGVR